MGRTGEHLARTIVFDVSEWKAEFGQGITDLLVQRCGDAGPYPAALRTNDAGQVLWDVTRTDTAQAGSGRVQLIYLVDGHVAKSTVYQTWVEQSLDHSPEPPEGGQDWLDQTLAAGAIAKAGAERSEKAATQSEQILTEMRGIDEKVRQDRLAAEQAAGAARESEANALEAERVVAGAKQEVIKLAQTATQAEQDTQRHRTAVEEARKATEQSAGQSRENAAQTQQDLIEVTELRRQVGVDRQAVDSAKSEAQRQADLAGDHRKAAEGAAGNADAAEKRIREMQSQINQDKLDANASARAAEESANQAANSEKATKLAEKNAADSAQRAKQAEEQVQAISAKLDIETVKKSVIDRTCPPFEKKGPIVQGQLVEQYPMEVRTLIGPVQQKNSRPQSPENPWPIPGITQLKVVVCGQNLTETIPSFESQQINGLTVTVKGKEVTVKGTATQDTYLNFQNVIPFLKDESTIILDGTNKPVSKYGITVTDFVYEKRPNEETARAYLVFLTGKTVDKTFHPSAVAESSVAAYEPYTGQTFTQTLPEEVCGGVYEWDTGLLTVTIVKTTNAGDGWTDDGNNFLRYSFTTNNKLFAPTEEHFGLCNIFKYVFSARENGVYAIENVLAVGKQLRDQFASLQEFTETLKKTPLEIVYTLAQPYTIQLEKHCIFSKDSGITTVYGDGETQVMARNNPVVLMAKMQKDIAALQQLHTQI